MYSRSDFSKWFAILLFLIYKINSQESETFINKFNDLTLFQIDKLLAYNHTDYISICDEGDTLYCYKESIKMMKEYKFIDPKLVPPESHYSLYNNIVSDFWYYAGHIEYWGLVKKKANLNEGLQKFITSAFFGNPKALYKLYIITETDLMPFIVNSKEFQNLIRTREELNYIFDTKYTNFSLNFFPKDEYAKNSISLQFLFASALAKFPPAMTSLAYKYYKGYGVNRSCETALKYYKETSYQNLKSIVKRKKPNYYEKVNLATYEYIGHKFSNEILDVEDIIEYFKVEAQNGQIAYIQQLGQRYLYGQGIPQDFDQAFYYFGLGSKMNDSVSIFYLGEMYLNGWGTEKNYSEAFRLFSQAMNLNNSKAWNSLGYMYYYGLGVEKNIRRAYDYFKISFSKGEESDAYFNMITLLTEGNGKIDVDFPNAYKYANFIAAKGHTYGTYFFAMLNQYQLGSVLKTCEITVEFFKQVSERSLQAKKKFDTAIKLYRDGFQKLACLIYMELAEEGFEFGQLNVALILKNYDVFIDTAYNKFLSFKYFKIAYRAKNIFATLNLAEFYHYGFGDLPRNATKAADLYRKVILSGSENSFYVSHAYFNLGLLTQDGVGIEKNLTKALRFYNLSSHNEPNAYYPSLLMRYSIDYQNISFGGVISSFTDNLWLKFTTPGLLTYSIIIFFVFYICFFISLYFQKE